MTKTGRFAPNAGWYRLASPLFTQYQAHPRQITSCCNIQSCVLLCLGNYSSDAKPSQDSAQVKQQDAHELGDHACDHMLL